MMVLKLIQIILCFIFVQITVIVYVGEMCVSILPRMLRCIYFTLSAREKLLSYWTHLVVAYSLRGTLVGASFRVHYLFQFLVQIYESLIPKYLKIKL